MSLSSYIQCSIQSFYSESKLNDDNWNFNFSTNINVKRILELSSLLGTIDIVVLHFYSSYKRIWMSRPFKGFLEYLHLKSWLMILQFWLVYHSRFLHVWHQLFWSITQNLLQKGDLSLVFPQLVWQKSNWTFYSFISSLCIARQLRLIC